MREAGRRVSPDTSSAIWFQYRSTVAFRFLAVALLALFVSGEAAAKKKTPKVFCSPGRFAMALPLLEGGPSPDAFLIEGDMERADVTVSLASGCAPVAAKVKAKRKFTTVKAKWESCDGFTKVRLKAKIHAPDCAVMTGKLKTKDYRAECLGCHIPAKNTDWIYVEGYEVLR